MNIDVDSRQSADFPRPAHAVALLSPARAQRSSISPSYHRKPTSRKVQGRGFQGPVKVREVPRRGARSLAVGETDGQGVAQESIPPGPKILWPAFLAPVGNDLRPPGRHPTSTLTRLRRPPSCGVALPSLPDWSRCRCLIRTSASLALLQVTYFSYTYWGTRNIREIL